MSAQMIVFAIFALGAVVTFPKAIAQLFLLWIAISVFRALW